MSELLAEIENGLVDSLYSELCYQLYDFGYDKKDSYDRGDIRKKVDWIREGTGSPEACEFLKSECYWIARDYEEDEVFKAMGLDIDACDEYLEDDDNWLNFCDWISDSGYVDGDGYTEEGKEPTPDDYEEWKREYFDYRGAPRDFVADLLYDKTYDYFFYDHINELKEAVVDKFLAVGFSET